MTEQDHIDKVIAKWGEERPDYDLGPVEIIGRVGRIAEHIDRALEEKFEEFGISRATFDVLATLRRDGPPYTLSQRELMHNLLRTSGSVSVRIDAMEKECLVTRDADPRDRRSTLVSITHEGIALIEKIVPHHLANEERLIAVFSGAERRELIRLLRKWSLALDSAEGEEPAHLGIIVLNSRLSRQRRRAAGLPDVPGILVHGVDSDSAAASAGLRRGDLIVAVGDTPIASQSGLRRLLSKKARDKKLLRILRGAQHLELELSESATD